jgi:hypothetical protein
LAGISSHWPQRKTRLLQRPQGQVLYIALFPPVSTEGLGGSIIGTMQDYELVVYISDNHTMAVKPGKFILFFAVLLLFFFLIYFLLLLPHVKKLFISFTVVLSVNLTVGFLFHLYLYYVIVFPCLL